MFFPWTAITLLAFESTDVIYLRLSKIGRGGSQAIDEVRLMFAEKVHAASEAAAGLMTGETAADLVARYRIQVAKNQARLEVPR